MTSALFFFFWGPFLLKNGKFQIFALPPSNCCIICYIPWPECPFLKCCWIMNLSEVALRDLFHGATIIEKVEVFFCTFLTRTCFSELVWNWRWSMVASCKWGLLLWRSHGWMPPGLVGPQKFVFCVFHPVAKGDGTAFGPDVQPQCSRATFQHTFEFYVVQFWRDNKQQKVHKSLAFRKKTTLWQFISDVSACFSVYDLNSISWIVLKFINLHPAVTYRCCIPLEVSDLETWDFSSPCCSQWCTSYQVRR